MTPAEKLKWNQEGIKLFKKVGYDVPDYDELRKLGVYGFTWLYILSWDETDLVNKADVNTFKELITIDEKLGTTMTQQLWYCVLSSLRMDILKV